MQKADTNRTCVRIAILTSLLVTSYVAYFYYVHFFGVYSDDQYWVSIYRTGNLDRAVIDNIMDSGRVLGFLYLMLGLKILLGLGGVTTAYLGVGLSLAVESMLVYLFFENFFPRVYAFMLALIFLLYIPDTSKFHLDRFLTHLPSVLFWMAALLYTRGHRVSPAALAASTVLSYETHVIQSFFIPAIVFLLRRMRTGQFTFTKEEIKQAVLYLGTFVAFSGILIGGRLIFAPGHLPTEYTQPIAEYTANFITTSVAGVRALVASHLYRVQIVAESLSVATAFIALATITVNIGLWTLWREPENTELSATSHICLVVAFLLLCVGILLVFASYTPFALEPERPTTPFVGRGSEVHWGASVGYVIAWAGALALIRRLIPTRLAFLLSVGILICYVAVALSYFINYQLKLAENWRLQQTYFRMIRECLSGAEPKLVIVDSAEEEQREFGSEKIFDWSTGYVPLLFEKHTSVARQWPLVQPATLVSTQGKVIGSTVELRGLFTWYAYPTNMNIAQADIMVVKPLGGLLVKPPEFISIGDDRIAVQQTCRVGPLARQTGANR
jgi:hypothetical protein